MSTRTRTDSRRGRSQAREAERDARRDRFRLVLARADRGVLLSEDCAQLRADVEAEVTENDTHRRSAGGQQAAALRLHKRIEAAEACIAEAEADRDALAERLATAAKLAGGDFLPGDGWHLADTIRRLCEGEITPEQALDDTTR
ncbi:hypothetical protein [Streptomyces malaysiensis]|uniref:Uncharacterized protein n=1 Tax=Streptomyces malaysiensis subsp. samsunensis TaxID=459658 RepID=A0A9X2RTK8_STRMQ|nr:hypothetical protein [Streptomyces samsunensis]MCQ8829843.1 hypothetical protein [Streptomyces samsunensis]